MKAMDCKNITKIFGSNAKPHGEFFDYLKTKFGNDTAAEVIDVFQKMGLPVPEDACEFMPGTEGAIVFLNPYGLVLRVEFKNSKVSPSPDYWAFDRIDDNPWILQPLASIKAGAAIIEVCPGCAFDASQQSLHFLTGELWKDKIDFWDKSLGNMGRIPVATPQFPKGIPVIIDRLAVKFLVDSVAPIKTALEKQAADGAMETIEKLYAPLQKSFRQSFPDKQKMRDFWKLCQSYVQDGKMVAGWNDDGANAIDDIDLKKTKSAKGIAQVYESRLETAASVVSSFAPAVLRSPRQTI